MTINKKPYTLPLCPPLIHGEPIRLADRRSYFGGLPRWRMTTPFTIY